MKPTWQCLKHSLKWLLLAAITLALTVAWGTGGASAMPLPVTTPLGKTVIRIGGTGDNGTGDYTHEKDQLPAGTNFIAVEYPASFAPIGAISYDESVAQGVSNTMTTAQGASADSETIVGFSQGARVAGDSGQIIAHSADANADHVNVVAIADPRAPRTGLEVTAHALPFTIPGATATGERGDMGVVHLTERCMKYDPICDTSGLTTNGVVGVINAGAGYWLEHMGNGRYTYDTPGLEPSTVWTEGNTTFEQIDAPAPIVQLADNAGIPTSPETRDFVEAVSAESGPFNEPAPPANPVADATAAVEQTVDTVMTAPEETTEWVPDPPAAIDEVPDVPQVVTQATEQIQQVVNTAVEQVTTAVETALPAPTPPADPAPVVDTIVDQVQTAIHDSPIGGFLPQL